MAAPAGPRGGLQTLLSWPPAAWQRLHRDTRVALLVLLVAFFVRLNGLAAPVDNPDEGGAIMVLRLMAHGHLLDQSIQTDHLPGLWVSLLPGYLLAGQTIWAARVAVVVWSLVALGAAWWSSRMLAGPRAGLMTLAMLAFDPFNISQARVVQPVIPGLAWSLLAVALALHARSLAPTAVRARRLWQVVAVGMALLGALTDNSAIVPLVIVLGMIALPAPAGVPAMRRDGVMHLFICWTAGTLFLLLFQHTLTAAHLATVTAPLGMVLGCWAAAPAQGGALRRDWLSAWPSLVTVLVVAVGLISVVAQRAQPDVRATSDLVLAAAMVDLVTAPDQLVVTDDPMVTVLADRTAPPALADPSRARLAAGQLTTAMVIAAASDPRVGTFLWWSGTFDRLPGLASWVGQHFVKIQAFGGNAGLYVRTGPTIPVAVTAG